MPHPYFVPVRLRMSRKTHNNGIFVAASTVCSWPLIRNANWAMETSSFSVGSRQLPGHQEAGSIWPAAGRGVMGAGRAEMSYSVNQTPNEVNRRGIRMKLLLKLDLLLLALMAFALVGVSFFARSFLNNNAQAQVLHQAELMMESASSTRQYTTEELKPLLQTVAEHAVKFLPQTVPTDGATSIFARLRKKFPEYTYKEATLNPTNLSDRAVDWETDVIENFRNHRDQKELVGERNTPTGPALYLAHPI